MFVSDPTPRRASEAGRVAVISHGYSRVNVERAGMKFYAPYIVSFGRTRHLKRVHKTATEAKAYAARFAKRLERFLVNAEEKV